MDTPCACKEEDATTWVATDYWSQYGVKVGTNDLFFCAPIHVVLVYYLQQYGGPDGHAEEGYFRFQDTGVGGPEITLQEFYENGTLFCERRFYVVVKEK